METPTTRVVVTYTKKGQHYESLGYSRWYNASSGAENVRGPITEAFLFAGAVMPPFLRLMHGFRDGTGHIEWTSSVEIPLTQITETPELEHGVPLPSDMTGSDLGGSSSRLRITLLVAPPSVTEPNGPCVSIEGLSQGRRRVEGLNPQFDFEAFDRMFQTFSPMTLHLWVPSTRNTFQDHFIKACAKRNDDKLAILTRNCHNRVFDKNFTDIEHFGFSVPDPVVGCMDVRQLELVTAYREYSEHTYQVSRSRELGQATQTGFFYPVAGTLVKGRYREFDLLILSTEHYRLMLDPDDEIEVTVELRLTKSQSEKQDGLFELRAKYIEVPKHYLRYCRKALRVRMAGDISPPVPSLSEAEAGSNRTYSELKFLNEQKRARVSFTIDQPVHPTTFSANLNAANLFVKFRQEPSSGPGALANYIVRGLNPCRNHDVADHFPMVKAIKDTLVHRYSGKEEFQNLLQGLDGFLEEIDQEQQGDEDSANLPAADEERRFRPPLPKGVDRLVYRTFMDEVEKLDRSQRQLFLNMMNVPQGIHLCHGYPGSGKTSTTQLFLAACLAVPAPIDTSCSITKAPEERLDPPNSSEASDTSGYDCGQYQDPDEASSPSHCPSPVPRRVPQTIYSGNTNNQCDHLAASLSARCKELGIDVSITRYEGSIEKVKAYIHTSFKQRDAERHKDNAKQAPQGTGHKAVDPRQLHKVSNQIPQVAGDKAVGSQQPDKASNQTPQAVDREALFSRKLLEHAEWLKSEKAVNGVLTVGDRILMKFGEEGEEYSTWSKQALSSLVKSPAGSDDKTYDQVLKALIGDVIETTDVLVCTGVRAKKLKEEHAWYFNPVIDMKEEAGRETEALTLGTWACFPGTLLKMLIGDPKQCGPVLLHSEAYKAKNKEERFVTPEQLYTSSLLERLLKLGCSSTVFRYNHRSKHQLAAFSSEHIYNGDMVMAADGDESPEESRQIQDFVRRHFKMKDLTSHRLMVGTVDCPSSARGTGSVNVDHADFIANLVRHIRNSKLTMKGEPVSILIISNYRAQVQEIKNAIAALKDPEARSMTQVRTTFNSMSLDANIVISDFVRSRNAGVGFNGREHLMNVMTTRAKDFEIVLIPECLANAMQPDRDNQKLIHHLVEHCKAEHTYLKSRL